MTDGTPAWVRDAVVYQVFPDRFASSPRVPKPGDLEAWDAPPTQRGFKGGDLLGLAERLDELADLGINALYLNPIFSAGSNHRYDTWDPLAVDPLLGGDAAFRELLAAAHDRGIRVLLDGVFNHVGRGFRPFAHVLENGAASPYRDWFYLDDDVLAARRDVVAYPDPADPNARASGYRAWWGVPSLPKLRVEHPPVRAYLLDVAERWTRTGIDGWRLDVPADVEDPTFWPAFRERVRSVNPDAWLVGEIWSPAADWLGDRFDGLMDYPLGMAILGFAAGGHVDRDVAAGQMDYRERLADLDGAVFGARTREGLAVAGPPAAAMLTLLGSHDTPRARSVLANDLVRLRLAALLLLTLPGTPSIYYGDELAMAGRADPDCRRGYPSRIADAGDDALAHRAYVRAAITARREQDSLRRGAFQVLVTSGRAIAFERTAEGGRAVVAVNAGEEPATLDIGAAYASYRRLGAVDVGDVTVDAAIGRLRLGPASAAVLVEPRP